MNNLVEQQHIQRLTLFSKELEKLEERHNEVLDVQHAIDLHITEFSEIMDGGAQRLREEVDRLKEEVQKRLHSIQRGAVLLSLIAQQQEFAPVQRKVEETKYEFLAEGDWFREKLTDQQ